jgi:hypothetical protein
MWVLAALSLVTVAQRLHSVRARRVPSTRCARPCPRASDDVHPRRSSQRSALGGPAGAADRPGLDLGYATGWRLVRAMPEFLARNAFDAGAWYAALGGGPEQLRRTWPG